MRVTCASSFRPLRRAGRPLAPPRPRTAGLPEVRGTPASTTPALASRLTAIPDTGTAPALTGRAPTGPLLTALVLGDR